MITLKPGVYCYDIGGKDGKDHIFDSDGNMIFESSGLIELFEVFHFNKATQIDGFKNWNKYVVKS